MVFVLSIHIYHLSAVVCIWFCFCSLLSPLFTNTSREDRLLIIQCDSGHLYGDLIACARYRIDDERERAHARAKGRIHVLFIIHLPRRGDVIGSSFVGFQGGQWVSAHINELQPSSEEALTVADAISAPISDLFYNMGFVSQRRQKSSKQSVKHTQVMSSSQATEAVVLEGVQQQQDTVPSNAVTEPMDTEHVDKDMNFKPKSTVPQEVSDIMTSLL